MIDFTNLGEGSSCEKQREDVGRVEADEAACVGPGLSLGLRLGEAETEQPRGRQENKLRMNKDCRKGLRNYLQGTKKGFLTSSAPN